MILDRLGLEEAGGGLIEHSARLRWDGGEHRLFVKVESAHAPAADDASAFLGACVLPAMKVGEDLRVEGSACPALLTGLEQVQAAYAAWSPQLKRVSVSAEAERSNVGGREVGLLFSGGVDSTYTAARERSRIDRLLFCDGLEPVFGAATRAGERRRAAEAAERLKLPLVWASTNARELVDRLGISAEDSAGAVLALIALSHGALFSRVLIPSSDSFATVEPCGTSPLVDPLFSTATTAIEHGQLELDRLGKLRWLVRDHPGLLAGIRVCASEDVPTNCGRCGKCVITMTALAAAGGLELATGFPDEVEPDALGALKFESFQDRHTAAQIAAALSPGELREALLDALMRSAVRRARPAHSFRDHRRVAIEQLMDEGRVWPPAGDDAQSVLGLVRTIDREEERHRYAVGRLPLGELVGELGAVCLEPRRGRTPVWLGPGGEVWTNGYRPDRPTPSWALAARWVLAPLSWRGFSTAAARVGGTLRRVAHLARLRRAPEPTHAAEGLEPAGYLYTDPAPNRLMLWSGVHPVTGDQLLATSWDEPNALGYRDLCALGYLEAVAPLTGRVGCGRPALFWASWFGRPRDPSTRA